MNQYLVHLVPTRAAQVRQQPRGDKLPQVPKDVPDPKPWYVPRDDVVETVSKILSRDGGPTVAALIGQSGSGKTTAAAAMVGKRGSIRPHAGETEHMALARLNSVMAHSPDGVIYLPVGKDSSKGDRLPDLMHRLAKKLHMTHNTLQPPAGGENGESYVKRIVSENSLRCLVVADDVWNAEVVERLRKTGMWVLLTTRDPTIVGRDVEKVFVDKLTQAEAEDVLRGAAGIPEDKPLCESALEVVRICGYVAMDIAFVGSWSSVRTDRSSRVPKSNEAWADVVRTIMEYSNQVRARRNDRDGGATDDREINRLAVLMAGYRYIGQEDADAQELYATLAVLPRGYSFAESDAEVLLGNNEVASGAIELLERWAVLERDTDDRYRMHDAHAEFARGKLDRWEDVRKPAVQRWASHISLLEVALGMDFYILLDTWHALKDKGGKEWWISRPYDDHLVQMDATDRSKSQAVDFVAEFYAHDRRFSELEELMERVLEHYEDHDGDRVDVKMAALIHLRQSLYGQGEWTRAEEVERGLRQMLGPAPRRPEHDDTASFPVTSAICNIFGLHARAVGDLNDAKDWFQKALEVEEDNNRSGSVQYVRTLHELGRVLQEAWRLEEAEVVLKLALEIKEVKLGGDHLHVAWTLGRIGICQRNGGRLLEAEKTFRRSLDIRERVLGPRHPQVAWVLGELGLCMMADGRPEVAYDVF
ncbi:MAG: tetratricopeptide repeat protein, partial [Verrucomicrobiota bacterium]